jgi:hypothetical protein
MKASKSRLNVPKAAKTTYRLFHTWHTNEQKPQKVTQKDMSAAWEQFNEGNLGADKLRDFEEHATLDRARFLADQESWQGTYHGQESAGPWLDLTGSITLPVAPPPAAVATVPIAAVAETKAEAVAEGVAAEAKAAELDGPAAEAEEEEEDREEEGPVPEGEAEEPAHPHDDPTNTPAIISATASTLRQTSRYGRAVKAPMYRGFD